MSESEPRVVSAMVSSSFDCRACGESVPIPIPCSLERFLERGAAFAKDHAGCALEDAGAAALLGARLRAVRQDRKLTQEAVAGALGVQTSQLSHWETGRREPSVRNLRRIAAALSVRMAFLLGEEELHG